MSQLQRSLSVLISKQRWMTYNARRSIIKRLYPAMLRDFPFETRFFDPALGLRFQGNVANFIDRWVYFAGGYEKYMLILLRGYVARAKAGGAGPITFADIGANVGNHTVFMARLVDRVLAFEPFERVRKQLEKNLALNRLENVAIFAFALGNEEKTMPFYAGPETNLGSASLHATHRKGNTYLGDVQLRRGDDVLAQAGSRVDIVKVDVEGHERYVLEGLRLTLARDRPLVIVELSPSTRATFASAAEFLALFPERYRFFHFASASFDTGRYHLAAFDYERARPEQETQDVIACPEEKRLFLQDRWPPT